LNNDFKFIYHDTFLTLRQLFCKYADLTKFIYLPSYKPIIQLFFYLLTTVYLKKILFTEVFY